MRKIERLLIAVGVIFFASYIIHLPMCNQDYLCKSSIHLSEDMYKHSTLSQSIKEVLRTNDIVENIENANYAQTECQFRYCGTAIPFLTVRSTAR